MPTQKSATLQPGTLYEGEVHAVDPFTGRLDVMVHNVHLKNLVYMPRMFGAMLGFTERMVPDKGTVVKVLFATEGEYYVVGAAPDRKEVAINERIFNTSGQPDITGEGQIPFGEAGESRSSGYGSADMIPGEYQISNIMDVGLTFLTRCIKMHASQRAKVECCLQDELVRIVSRTFRHISSLGETEIYEDGRTSSRTTEGSWSHERRGFEKGLQGFDRPENRQETPNRVKKKSPEDLERTEVLARFQEYRGWIGDFIHKFITEPEEVLSATARFPAGRWREHVGSKGNYLMQSVDEIAFEKVIRVVVPAAKKKWFQNAKEKREKMQRWNPDYFKTWEYKEDDNYYAHHAAFQLREYARWFAGYQSYARFHQAEEWGEYEVPTETQSPEHERDAYDADREESGEGIASGQPDDIVNVYSTIRIFKDGGILLLDGNGACVHSFAGNLFLSARKNIRCEAGQDIVLMAGNDLILQGRRNVEITAIVGGILTKARSWWEAVCEKGSMLLESFAPKPEDAPSPVAGEPEPRVGEFAVMMRANNGRAAIDGDRQVNIIHRGAPPEDEPGVRILSRIGKVDVAAQQGVALRAASGNIDLFNDGGNIRASAINAIFDTQGSFRIVDKMAVTPAGASFKNLVKAERMAARQIFNEEVESGFPLHSGHVFGVSSDSAFLEIDAAQLADPTNIDDDAGEAREDLSELDPFPLQTFSFIDPDDYRRDVKDGGEDFFMESLVNQHLRLDNPSHYDEDYVDLNLNERQLMLPTSQAEFKYPYPGPPGQALQLRLASSNLPGLNTPLSTPYKDLDNKGTNLTPSDFSSRIVEPD